MRTTSTAPSQPGATSLLRWPLILLCLLALLYHTEITSTLALGPIFSQDFSLTDMQLALVTNAAVLFSALLALPLALVVDAQWRIRLPLLAGGILLWSVLIALRGTASSFLLLLGLCFPSGIGLASSAAPTSALLYDLYPARLRSQALGVLSAGQALGTFVGFLLPGILTRYLSWRFLYLGFAVGGLLLFLPILRLHEPSRESIDAAPLPASTRSWWWHVGAGTRHLLNSRGTLIGIAGYSAQAFGIGGIATFLPLFLVRYYASSSADADSMVAIVIVALVVGSALGGWVDARAFRRYGTASHILVAGGATLALGFLFGLAVLLSSLVLFLLLSVVSGALLGITTAPLLALIGERVASSHRNYAYAVQGTLAALCQGAGGLAVGTLADTFQSLRLALLLFSGIVVLIGLWMVAQQRASRESPTLQPSLVPIPSKPSFQVPARLPASSWISASSADPTKQPRLVVSLDTLEGDSWSAVARESQEETIEAAVQALGPDTSIAFFSRQGFQVLVHPDPHHQGWLLSHLLPAFGVCSIPISSRLLGLKLALQDDGATPSVHQVASDSGIT